VLWVRDIGDMKAAYNAFDIATLSSAFGEGFPNMVGEAMACGVPVAATDVGDVRLIIGEVGEVVPPKNPYLLCTAWRRLRQRLAQNPGLRNDARDRIVANYSVDTMVRRTEDILSQLTAGRPAQEIAREFT
jgi:glycosyltransferase involved in cell wall biosynthesis